MLNQQLQPPHHHHLLPDLAAPGVSVCWGCPGAGTSQPLLWEEPAGGHRSAGRKGVSGGPRAAGAALACGVSAAERPPGGLSDAHMQVGALQLEELQVYQEGKAAAVLARVSSAASSSGAAAPGTSRRGAPVCLMVAGSRLARGGSDRPQPAGSGVQLEVGRRWWGRSWQGKDRWVGLLVGQLPPPSWPPVSAESAPQAFQRCFNGFTCDQTA